MGILKRAIFIMIFPLLVCAEGHSYKAEKNSGVPEIFVDGNPVRGHMVYVRTGTLTGELLDEIWRDYSFEFTSPVDFPKCALQFRFRKTRQKIWISKVEVRNLSSGKVEKSLAPASCKIDSGMGFWCEGKGKRELPFSLSNIDCEGTRALLLDARDVYKMNGFHLIFGGLKASKNMRYEVRIRAKSEFPDRLDVAFRKACDDYMLFGGLGKGALPEQVKMAAIAGAVFVNICVRTPWWQDKVEPDFGAVKAVYDSVIKANRNARLIPRVILSPSKDWIENNREEMVAYGDGHSDEKFVSISSRKYREDSVKTLQRFIEYSEKYYGKNMAGYQPCFHILKQELFYSNTWKGAHAGFDSQTIAAWRSWLKNKYTDDSALQTAWKNQSVTFQTAEIFSSARRDSTGALLDLQKESDIFDFNLFLQNEMSTIVTLLAREIKRAAPNRFSVFFYAYGIEFSSVPKAPAASGHYGLLKVLKSKDVDIICGPISYLDRKYCCVYENRK